MNKKRTSAIVVVVVVLVIAVLIGVVWYYETDQSASYQPPTIQTSTVTQPISQNPTGTQATPGISETSSDQNAPVIFSITYQNAQYGFNFSLPADWQGYSIVKSQWEGNAQGAQGDVLVATGTLLYIRNPNWTSSNHYEDIPIMVFTTAQWSSYQAGDFSTSAAPFDASELGHNNQYVFALPPRYDYDFSTGYQEVEEIMQMNPLHAFNL